MTQGQALQGLRVLEFGDYISAAYCTRLLAHYGAEVIKIERPPAGDLARRHGPFPNDGPHPEKSGLFLLLNAGKLGVTLDPETSTGRALLLDLVRQADVLVENHRPDEMERWDLTYETLGAVNPSLVMTSITTFGQSGPNRDRKAYAITASAASGVAFRIGDPARQPLTMPYDRADYWGGMNAATATMLAIMARWKSGRGQQVDISTADCLNTYNNPLDYLDYVDTGYYPRRNGHRNPAIYPFVLLPCKDGYFGLIVGNDRQWARFLQVMGNPAWADDPRYKDRNAMDLQRKEELDNLIKPWLAQRTKAELWEIFRKNRIPWHPVQTVDELLEWEQLKVRDYWDRTEHPDAGAWTLPGAPFKLSETPATPLSPAPRLGADNTRVYCELLGLSELDMARLWRTSII
ncbi:MAG: CoA transferase [Chloroflexi bacterium]|nr:CoA transferase [Chloroflexota bacterium]